ncbi:MAG: GNAT family N-acetyltransferase [Methanobacteriota archaeon]|nr:MAG: GNAT family N-acetyltransferase [Euryarchaeota archaeon]
MAEITIRELSLDDVPRMVEIYKGLTGDEIDEDTMSEKIEYGQCLTALGAEADGMLVGFIIGETNQGTFGEDETVGWINMVGLDKKYRKMGIGTKLGKELLARFQGLGIKKIRTIVEDRDYGLLNYFRSLGLEKVPWTVLELNFT